MRGIAVVSPTFVTEPMLIQFIEGLGGCWFRESEVPSGTIERGSSAVYIYAPSPVNFRIFDSQQMQDLRDLIGDEPRSYIELGFGRDKGSDALGEEFVRSIIKEWGGVIQGRDGSFMRLTGAPVQGEMDKA